MFFLNDINNFNKKEINIKSYVRQGRLVKQSKRKINIKDKLIKAGIGVAGLGASVGIGYLLNKRSNNKLIKNVEELINNKSKVNNEEIINKMKQNIDLNQIKELIKSENQTLMGEVKKEIGKNNENLLTKLNEASKISPKLEQSVAEELIDSSIEEVSNLTRRNRERLKKGNINNILNTNLNRSKLETQVAKLSDEQLDKSIKDIEKSWTDVSIAMGYKNITREAQQKLSKLSDRYAVLHHIFKLNKTTRALSKSGLSEGLTDELNSYMKGFTVRSKNGITKIENDIRNNKISNDLLQELFSSGVIREDHDIFHELNNKNLIPKNIKLPWKNDIGETYMDEFTYKINTYNFSYPMFLSDINVDFGRTLGAKDKHKRLKNATIERIAGTIHNLNKLKKIKK